MDEEQPSFNDAELTELAIQILTEATDLDGIAQIIDPDDSLLQSTGDCVSDDEHVHAQLTSHTSSYRPISISSSPISPCEDIVYHQYPTQSKYNEILPPISIPSSNSGNKKPTLLKPISIDITPSYTPKLRKPSVPSFISRKSLSDLNHRASPIPDFSDIGLKTTRTTSHKNKNKKKRKKRKKRTVKSKTPTPNYRKNKAKAYLFLNEPQREMYRGLKRAKSARCVNQSYNEYAIETENGFVFIQTDTI